MKRSDATPLDISSSLIETVQLEAMYTYYQIHPKVVMQEFAVFYCSPDMAEELKLEVEIIMGIPLKFESIEEKKLSQMMENSREKEKVLH